MAHAVIPAPARYEALEGPGFVLRPGTAVVCADATIAPLLERFCAQVARYAGGRMQPGVSAAPDQPFVLIDLSGGADLHGLTAPAGLAPGGGEPDDERYSLLIGSGRIVVRAAGPAGAARGLTTLTQLAATAGQAPLAAARIADAPRYAWRGLSLDVARNFRPTGDIRRVIDLLEFYKLNVLHLHLTDDQAWRLPMGRPAASPAPAASYSEDDLRALAAYAADRFVTIVPEVDTPGHVTALLGMRPELRTGRNDVDYEVLAGHPRHATWLDPELPATFELIEEVLAGVAGIFPGPYLHIGADEPRAMPDELYVSYVQKLRDLVRGLGRRPLGWQETARAGLDAEDVIQFWLTDFGLPDTAPPQVRAQVAAELALARQDVDAVVAASVPAIVSPLPFCYLDVPYAEPSADPAQAETQNRLGLRVYAPRSTDAAFGWDPGQALGPGAAAQVAGVEAAIWAETITSFGDLCFLLLPRLAGVAHKAWSAPEPGGPAAGWPAHRDRLARHGAVWAADGLDYFRSSAVDWA